MGHWSGKKYTFKLNEEHETYEKILIVMDEEINKKHQDEEKDPGESFSAYTKSEAGRLVYSSSSYKSRVSNDFSSSLIKLIEKNIDSDPEVYYYIKEDNGEEAGSIINTYGYANKILQAFKDAQYAESYGLYNREHIPKFHECFFNKALLEEIMKEGEKMRYLNHMRDRYNNTHTINRMQNDPPNNKCFYKGESIDEKWLAFFLAYGTNAKLYVRASKDNTRLANLKEFLYINDNYFTDRDAPYNSKRGAEVLKLFTQQGVTFSEEPENIEPPIYKKNGLKITKNEVEDWYETNKADFNKMPVFSEETLIFLEKNFPATLEKLKLKLEELTIKIEQLNQGNIMEDREYWSGKSIDKLQPNEIFVFGSNPEGRHGAGAAKAAVSFGATYGNGRGLCGNTYALITKNLKAGFTDPIGITYPKEGFKSVSPEQIRDNIDALYECARNHKDKKFFITYQYETYPNGAPKASLNGYTSQEMLEMFVHDDIPSNIIFHDSYAPHLAKLLKPAVEAPTYTYFFHLTSPFSNFHPAKFEYKDLTFISNEQFMMYSKAKTFKDEVIAEKIMNIHKEFEISPGVFRDEHSKNCYQVLGAFKRGEITVDQILKNKEYVEAWNTIHKKIKALGRQVSNYDDAVWNEKRVPVVYFGAKLKFSQNPHLYDKLMSTGNSIMVEASPYDKIWGTGLNAADSAKAGPLNWPGQNLLGHVLTELKKYFVLELTKPNKPKM